MIHKYETLKTVVQKLNWDLTVLQELRRLLLAVGGSGGGGMPSGGGYGNMQAYFAPTRLELKGWGEVCNDVRTCGPQQCVLAMRMEVRTHWRVSVICVCM